ncbi:cilium assembly protein DZIP1L isoform X3 [Aethina tumida]|nr:cilium assembly protein DZIP1L isoform X3 [Aethina tumida]
MMTNKFNEYMKAENHKCPKCSKMFTSELYLNSHLKRRHNLCDDNSSQSEADKLQSEIKQLKERINNTEKLIQDKNAIEEKSLQKDKEKQEEMKIKEIQENFDRFRNQVENELKILQMQKSFYEEKYGKLIDVVSDSIIQKQNEKELTKSKIDSDEFKPQPRPRRNSMTQTEAQKNKILTMQLVHHENLVDYVSPEVTPQKHSEKSEDVNIEETIDKKVSQGLAKIEGQMNIFLNKLNEVEEIRKSRNSEIKGPVQLDNKGDYISPETSIKKQKKDKENVVNIEETIDKKVSQGLEKIELQMNAFLSKLAEAEENRKIQCSPVKTDVPKRPPLKPRSKFTVGSKMMDYEVEANECFSKEKDIHSESGEGEIKVTTVKQPVEETSESETEEESIISEEEKKIPTKPSVSTLGQHSMTSLYRLADTPDVLKELEEEVKNVVNSRLRDIGVNPDWKGIPQKSYERAMDIINHQAQLTKKSFSDFTKIKNNLEKEVNRKIKGKSIPGKLEAKCSPMKHLTFSVKKKEAVPKINLKEVKSTQIVIKNREIYETESESESEAKPPLIDAREMQSRVIRELQLVLPKTDEREENVEPKGVLKNYPSVGSLNKKKVLFDLESEAMTENLREPNLKQIEERREIKVQEETDDTDTIASSVFGAVEGKDDVKKKEVDSDFDISDL